MPPTPSREPIVRIGADALAALGEFASARRPARWHLVADANTWQALGRRTCDLLLSLGCDVQSIVLPGPAVAADEVQIVQVLLAADPPADIYLAVGAGTITDITRFASHRLGRLFVSLPTAPSVDAYTSNNAPLVIRGVKRTVPAQMPVAVFADLDTLCRAPAPMIAAGFGDMLGKFTCLADWCLGHILWDEPYDEIVAADARAALQEVVSRVEAIARCEPAGIAALMRGLCASGRAIARLGNSAPASGSEHHLSHFMEMLLMREGRPAILHGAKVGACAVIMAGAYARLRGLTRQDVKALVRDAPLWNAETQMADIRHAYGSLAEAVIAEHRPFVQASAERQEALRHRIIENWDEVLAVAGAVPEPLHLARLLAQAGGVVRAETLGLSSDEVRAARRHAHYLRNRFTVRKLELALGLSDEGESA